MRSLAVSSIVITLGLLSQISLAALQIGDAVPNRCYNTVTGKPFCLDDAKDTVRVLVHSAGWCGPCNEEMDKLAPRSKDYAGMPVTFISISAYGWLSGSPPDQQFLTEWRDRHGIPFTVAASPKDPGKAYFDPPLFIPNVVIIDKNGKLAYKEVAPEVEDLFQEINSQLKLR